MAVAFILSPDNVNFVSWGTKKINLPGTNIVFPAITRRRSSTVMFEQYLACALSEVLLSKKTFSRIVAALTANGAVLRKSVDYVVGLLIYDSFDTLKTIVSRLNLTSTRISDDMELVKPYLKYGFDQSVKSTTAQHCLLHNIKFGRSTPDDAATPLPRVICDDCKAVFYFFARFKDILALREVHPTTLKLVDDCSEKARLFLGHRIRTINQQLAIQRLVDQMRDQCMQSKGIHEAIVTLDFKMKLEPIYFRERTVDHYGKRGISWHGALVHYFEFNDGDSTGDQNPVNDMKVYYDHISKSDTKQDREDVVSILEAVLIRLRKDMPSIKKISLLTDDATCYQNWLLPLVAPYLSRLHGITVSRIIHTETQDGKSVLDAHFARSTHHVIDWVKKGNKCITPTQLVISLQSRGGMKKCISELVDHHRQRLTDLTRQVAPMEKALRKIMSCANEILISNGFSDEDVCVTTGYSSCPDFEIIAFEYSGIENGCRVVCSPRKGSCILFSDDAVQTICDELDSDEFDDEIFETGHGYNAGIVVDTETSANEISRVIGDDIEGNRFDNGS